MKWSRHRSGCVLKIYSAEVESVLASHPGVVETAIMRSRRLVLGERVHAVVVINDSDVTTRPLPRNPMARA
jgi:acyl-coenzyme A synthetase/AMP-(fatty) acid ligase